MLTATVTSPWTLSEQTLGLRCHHVESIAGNARRTRGKVQQGPEAAECLWLHRRVTGIAWLNDTPL